jgi:hypothetical protein
VAGLLVAVTVAGGGFVALNSAGVREGAGSTRSAGALPPATATVARQTLNDIRGADGELGYGPVTRYSTGPLDPWPASEP